MESATVGIRELKEGLSRYLRLVKTGTVIIITERGRPIGRLLPYDVGSDQRMVDFVRSGLASWNGQPLGAWQPEVALEGKKTVAEILIEDRG